MELCRYLSNIGKPIGFVELNPYKSNVKDDELANIDDSKLKINSYYDLLSSRSLETIPLLENVYSNLLLFYEHDEWKNLCDYTIDQEQIKIYQDKDINLIISEIESINQNDRSKAQERKIKEFESILARNIVQRVRSNNKREGISQSYEDIEISEAIKDIKNNLANQKLTPYQASNNLTEIIFSK